MLLKPLGELFSRHAAGRQVEHERFLLIERSNDLIAVQDQKHFDRGMADTFVAIEKRVVQDK